ncbi:hypothetical protein [Priestia megaterium]|uniref:hypothetical protein n=1 Tax=Priestia megaterium TaxID=1404 RepID=UPI001782031C|nr:hypothetical protein [Priestia megaterium]MBD8848402.1 hypothetical protein [Priestia megaterium]
MASNDTGVFDRDRSHQPLLRIFIHSELLREKILTKDMTVSRLLKLGMFPFLQVICSPTDDLALQEKIQEYEGVLQTKYKFYSNNGREFYTIVSQEFERTIAYGNEETLKKEFYNSNSRRLDFFAGKKFDYFIINSDNPILKNNKSKGNALNPEYSLELIRLLLINNRLFYINKNTTVNEGFYYLYRFKKIFHQYQEAWTIIVSAYSKSLITKELFEQFSSLSQRLEFACRSYDKLSFYDLKRANNDTQDNTLYHFSYFIMLITGIFDDLAWILKHLNRLNLSRMEIGLKVPVNKTSTKFYNKLKQKNEKLCKYLMSQETQTKIKLFYPLRDTLQHRQFLHGVRYKNDNENIDKNLFIVPEGTVELINSLSNDINEYGVINVITDYYLDTHVFALKALQVVAEIVNNTLSLMELDRIKKLLDVKESKYNEKIALEVLFDWDSEPIYF